MIRGEDALMMRAANSLHGQFSEDLMKVLWLSNYIPEKAAQCLGIEDDSKAGMAEGMLSAIASYSEDIELGIAFPVPEQFDGKRGSFKMSDDSEFSVSCYPFYEDMSRPDNFDLTLISSMNRILDEFRPDVIHILGTEFPHALAMSKAATDDDFHYHPGKERLLVSFRGICAAIAADYLACLPDEIVSSSTLRDTLLRDNIRQQQDKFHSRAVNELEAVSRAGHIGGCTGLDKKWASRLGPEAQYHHLSEAVRPVFYEPVPAGNERDRNTIFVAGAYYPLKGFHILLKALKDINWPELKVRVAGPDIVSMNTLKDKVKISEYGKYLGELIEGCNLQGKITFLGNISAQQMREEYLKCGMYVCPSTVENTPNPVIEAALSEAPIIASRVGGIPDIIDDKNQCLLYDCNARKQMDEVAASLRKTIEFTKIDYDRALERGKAARARALKDHDPKTVAAGLADIYRKMYGEQA